MVHLPQWFLRRHSRVACVPCYPSWSQTGNSSDWSGSRSRGMVIGLRWAGRIERGRGASWKIAKVAEGEERISSCPPGVCYSPWSCSFRSFSLPLVFLPFPPSASRRGTLSPPVEKVTLLAPAERDVGHGPQCSAVRTLPTMNIINMEPRDSIN